MNPHDPKRIVDPSARQYWRAFVYVMQVHENRSIKRAGVAGVRARAKVTCYCVITTKELFEYDIKVQS